MKDQRLKKFATLILETCAGLKKGQKVVISADLAHKDQVWAFSEVAYDLGAAFVHVDWRDPKLQRIRYDHAQGNLDYLPDFWTPYWGELIRDRWVAISFTGKDDPYLMDGVDPSKQAAVAYARASKREAYHRAQMAKEFPWVVVPAPTAGWAASVLNLEPSEETLEKFWYILTPILKLDGPDPGLAWQTQALKLKTFAQKTTEKAFDRLHILAPGTDLHIGLCPQSQWLAGADTTSYGQPVMVNLPSEEVFTTPDWRRTTGRVTCTRPVEVLGTLVEGAWFEFEDGRVKAFGAAAQKPALEAFLMQDPQAGFLGEIALVDISSPIAQSGLVFREILLDENAACHFALGAGYPDGLKNSTGKTPQELMALGCNVARVHLDFMIGSPEMTILGFDSTGQGTPIMEKGRFVL